MDSRNVGARDPGWEYELGVIDLEAVRVLCIFTTQ